MILIFSLFLNCLFFYSLFDLYYRALDLSEQVDCNRSLKASSNRVVLVIADGLSAQLLYNVTAEGDSFIRHVMEESGTWGISEAKIPSVTLPGFFAILSGVYFDSSLFLKHVHFSKVKVDHLFNHVNEVFYSGDPNPKLFLEEETTKSWHSRTWDSELKDTAKNDYYKYDDFSFENMKTILSNASLKKNLEKNNTLFIVYLDASDRCGHNALPFSERCVDVVKNVDKHLKALDTAFQNFYQDNKTSFILTSDHGMTATGSHGGGEDISLYTPILAWGSGIKHRGGSNDGETPEVWKAKNLNHVKINQIDIAPLMSALLGIPAPLQSIGKLPTEILNIENTTLLNTLYCYEKQLWNIVLTQANSTGDFSYLARLPSNTFNVTEAMDKFEFYSKTNLTETIRLANLLTTIHRKQIAIYRYYFKSFILTIVSCIYIGWGILLLERALLASGKKINVDPPQKFSLQAVGRKLGNYVNYLKGDMCIGLRMFCDLSFLMIGVVLICYIQGSNWPRHFIVYVVTATLIWWLVIKNVSIFGKIFMYKDILGPNAIWAVITGISTIGVIFGINVPIARQTVFISLTLLQCFLSRYRVEAAVVISWLVSSVFSAFLMDAIIIDLLPDTFLMKIGGLTWTFFALLSLYYNRGCFRDYAVTFVLMFILIASQLNVISIRELKGRQLVDKKHHTLISWFILCTVHFAPLLSSLTGFKRLLHICFSVGCTFVLLSVRHEAVGLAIYCLHLLLWFYIEVQKSSQSLEMSEKVVKKWAVSKDEFIRGLMLLMYTWVGFYLIGNKDHPSSYNIYWADGFVETFQNLTVTLLVIYKTLTPIFILCFVFSMMYATLGRQRQTAVEWYLFLNNIVGLYFFHCTKGEGYSYVRIGYSFAHHAWTSFFPILIVILLPLADYLNKVNLIICYQAIKIYYKNEVKPIVGMFKK